ncbi:ATP-binding cassette domain-containing protein [Desulfurococcaceae archaeon MEX13E-LK6-19]|nr:ATP-binding cassette domain-containing protein [Desulfurococcaceae archaeon MEX13E-LK6-19]
MPVLALENVSITVNDSSNIIVKNVSLDIERGEIAVLLGPNGSGKSTLLYGIIGLPRYKIVTGKILFNGEDITGKPVWERARAGISLLFQSPPRIRVKLGYLAKKIASMYTSLEEVNTLVKELNVEYLLDRDLYDGFSGGEVKRTELFLTILQKPRVALLDEPDSGVDIDSIKRIASYIDKLADQGSAVLLVTHLGYILRYLDNLGKGYILINGRIVYSGDAHDVIRKLHLHGYKSFMKE